MRDNVLWRKEANIIVMLAGNLNISAEHALDTFYSTNVYRLLSDPKTGMRLMSDGYIVEDILKELRAKNANSNE